MASLPEPTPGLVIRYAYLWRHEARAGLDEGRKDRPCVIVLAMQREGDSVLVTVAPITHTPPERPDFAIEMPAATKARLGLDGERAWIIAADLNQFVWPGVDLRPISSEAGTYAYGLVPPGLYRQVRDRVLALARAGRTAVTGRTE